MKKHPQRSSGVHAAGTESSPPEPSRVQTSRGEKWATALLAFAAAAFFVAGRGDHAVEETVLVASAAVLALLGRVLLGRVLLGRVSQRLDWGGRAGWLLAAATAVPPAGGLLLFGVQPAEVMLVRLLCTAAVVLVILPATHGVRPHKLAAGSAVAALVATSLEATGLTAVLLATTGAAAAAGWLAARQAASPTPFHPAAHPPGRGARTGVVGVLAAACVVGLAAGAAAFTTRLDDQDRTALLALLPSSGGDGRGEEQAAGGVGDGPDELASPDALTGGFDPGDVWGECVRDCLYDAFVEAYGQAAPPQGPSKSQWIKLDEQRLLGRVLEQDLRSGRRLSTRRDASTRRRGLSEADREAGGMLYRVIADEADMPLRLPMTAFDAFDGQSWHEAPRQAVMTALDWSPRHGQLRPADQPVGRALGLERAVSVEVKHGRDNVLPLPGGLTGFAVGHLKRPDLITSGEEGILRMRGRSLPAGVTVTATYRPQVRRLLADEPLAYRPLAEEAPADVPAWVLALAGDAPRGWPQVQAVVSAVRDSVTHDPAADADLDPFAAVLLHRRATALQTATVTAVALQHLGYDVRLAGGFYVDASKADETGAVPVSAADVHVWPQVRLAAEAGVASSRGTHDGIARGGQWVDLEPTPGFGLADGEPTAAVRLADAASSAAGWLARHAGTLAACLLLAGLTWAARRRLAERLLTLRLMLLPPADGRRLGRLVLAVLERRGALAGHARPRHRTPGAWLPGLGASTWLSAATETLLYAPPAAALPDADRLRREALEFTIPPLKPGPRRPATRTQTRTTHADSPVASATGVGFNP